MAEKQLRDNHETPPPPADFEAFTKQSPLQPPELPVGHQIRVTPAQENNFAHGHELEVA